MNKDLMLFQLPSYDPGVSLGFSHVEFRLAQKLYRATSLSLSPKETFSHCTLSAAVFWSLCQVDPCIPAVRSMLPTRLYRFSQVQRGTVTACSLFLKYRGICLRGKQRVRLITPSQSLFRIRTGNDEGPIPFRFSLLRKTWGSDPDWRVLMHQNSLDRGEAGSQFVKAGIRPGSCCSEAANKFSCAPYYAFLDCFGGTQTYSSTGPKSDS